MKKKYANPVWHIHDGNPPTADVPLSFSLLLNLASVCNPKDKSVLWGFISTYAEGASPESMPDMDKLVERAIRYYEDFVKPNKKYRAPTDNEKKAMEDLAKRLTKFLGEDEKNNLLPLEGGVQEISSQERDRLGGDGISVYNTEIGPPTAQQASPAPPPGGSDKSLAEEVQTLVYAVGNEHGFENLREWFGALYEVLLGQQQGPRMGSFIALYGVSETITLINRALKGEDLAA